MGVEFSLSLVFFPRRVLFGEVKDLTGNGMAYKFLGVAVRRRTGRTFTLLDKEMRRKVD